MPSILSIAYVEARRAELERKTCRRRLLRRLACFK